MLVRILAGIILLAATGCQSRAQPQQVDGSAQATASDASLSDVNESVAQSRQNAINPRSRPCI